MLLHISNISVGFILRGSRDVPRKDEQSSDVAVVDHIIMVHEYGDKYQMQSVEEPTNKR